MYLKSVVSGLRLERDNCLTQTVKTSTMQTVKLHTLLMRDAWILISHMIN